jgi:hypothetical protein
MIPEASQANPSVNTTVRVVGLCRWRGLSIYLAICAMDRGKYPSRYMVVKRMDDGERRAIRGLLRSDLYQRVPSDLEMWQSPLGWTVILRDEGAFVYHPGAGPLFGVARSAWELDAVLP